MLFNVCIISCRLFFGDDCQSYMKGVGEKLNNLPAKILNPILSWPTGSLNSPIYSLLFPFSYIWVRIVIKVAEWTWNMSASAQSLLSCCQCITHFQNITKVKNARHSALTLSLDFKILSRHAILMAAKYSILELCIMMGYHGILLYHGLAVESS
jgi:hypothetical protein